MKNFLIYTTFALLLSSCGGNAIDKEYMLTNAKCVQSGSEPVEITDGSGQKALRIGFKDLLRYDPDKDGFKVFLYFDPSSGSLSKISFRWMYNLDVIDVETLRTPDGSYAPYPGYYRGDVIADFVKAGGGTISQAEVDRLVDWLDENYNKSGEHSTSDSVFNYSLKNHFYSDLMTSGLTVTVKQ